MTPGIARSVLALDGALDQRVEDAAHPRTASRGTINLMKFVAVFAFGGTERQFVNLGLALDPARFDLRFGCMRKWGHFLETIEARRIPVLEYQVRSFRDPAVLAAQVRLARDIRRHRIQLVHTYNFYANVFAIPAARFAGARVIASIRDMGLYLTPAQRRIQRWVCRLADRIVVNAHAIRDWLIADGYDARRISVIPNGIDLERFRGARRSSLRAEFGLAPEAPLVGVVSRVTRMKGLEDFLQAASRVAARFPAARFVIVGEGFTTRNGTVVPDTAYLGDLADLTRRLGLQDRVVFTGFRRDVEQILRELTVSVQPSLSEGLSNTVLESMAAGVPVVATCVGDTAEAVRDGETGILVPPRNASALADAIARLLGAPDLASRYGQAGHRLVADRFSISSLVTATTGVYESLLARRTV